MATPAKVPAKTWGLAGAKTAAATASPAKAGTVPAKGAAATAAPVEEKKDAAPVVEKPPFQANPAHLDGVADMSSLIYLEGDNVLHNLDCRYRKDEIYTSISKVLLAVNPYQHVDIYAPRVISLYRRSGSKRNNDLPPHVFSVSQLAYYNMLASQTNQSMIVCGESGSGKTESAKHLMRYLAYTDGDTPEDDGPRTEGKKVSIEKQVLDANPILESFGNAKTVLNNNSSRFGKFTKLVFTQHEVKEMTDTSYCANPHRKGCPIIEARIVGSYIETYLLEKSRVVQQDLNERNYHIFYELCDGGLDPALFTKCKLAAPETFHYLNQSKCVTIDGASDVERLTELREAMVTLRFSPAEQDDIFTLVAGILHLGNINFIGAGAGGPSRDGGANDPSMVHPKSKESMNNAAEMFQVEAKNFNTRLTMRNMVIRSQVIAKPLSKFEAEQNRDAMAKALYSSLFNFIVSRINDELFLVKARVEGLKWIGILDVFGFESFEHNSFEQFCINFCNERLQQYFNRYILKSEQDEYILEAIMWTPISVPDNQDTIDLVDKKGTGILAVLDSACKMPKGDDKAFVQNLFTIHPKHARLTQVTRVKKEGAKGIIPMNGFSISHYAGTVIYNAKDFLPKNADFTSPDTVALFAASKSPIGKLILAEPDESKNVLGGAAKKAAAPASGTTAFKSTGSVFSTQLNSLMTTLYDTTPHFVRCIKPNKLKKPALFNWDYVRPQLECGGIIDALRILKCGFPTRCTYEKIFSRYGKILQPTPPHLNKRDFCEAILRCAGETLDRQEFQLGLTKVFFRPGKQAFLESLLEEGAELPPETIKAIKRFLRNKRFFRVRGAIRAHLVFYMRLRSMRALRWVVRTFRVANVICGTMIASMKRVRARMTANIFQSYVSSALQMRQFKIIKLAVLTIESFYRHNKLRKPLVREVQKRIIKRRAMQSEQERKEREQRELERRDAVLREKMERERAEKDRREREAKELAEAAEREAERLRKAHEDAEREKEREKEERERRMQELQNMAEQAVQLRTQQELLVRQLEEKEKERAEADAEREKKIAHDREEAEKAFERAAAETRERDRGLFEGRIAELLEKQTKWEEEKNSDYMFKLVTNGAAFALLLHLPGRPDGEAPPKSGDPQPTPLFDSATLGVTPPTFVRVSDKGILQWQHEAAEDKAPLYPEADGEWSLDQVLEFITPADSLSPPSPAPAGSTDAPKPEGNPRHLTMVARNGSRITLQAETVEQRDEWANSLRYVLRNWRLLSTVGRPIGDPARGNMLAATLMHRLEMLESGKVILAAPPATVAAGTAPLTQLEEEEKKQAGERAVEAIIHAHGVLSGAAATSSTTTSTGTNTTAPPTPAHANGVPSGDQLGKLPGVGLLLPTPSGRSLRERAALEAKEKQREEARLKQTRQSIIRAGTTILLNESKKLKDLEDDNLRQTQIIKDLTEKATLLEFELKRYRGAEGKKESAIGEVVQKVQLARELVNEATNRVQQAEKDLDKRKDRIKQAMKTVAEHDGSIKNTTTTMSALGIEGKSREELKGDATANRLIEIRQKQLDAHAEAKAALLREYAAMVAEAEQLNQTREELEKRQFMRAKHEATHKELTKQQQRGVDASSTSSSRVTSTQAPVAVLSSAGTSRTMAVSAMGPAVTSSKNKKDDGCVVM